MKKHVKDVVKVLKRHQGQRHLRSGQSHPRRRAALEHSAARRLALPVRPGHGAPFQAEQAGRRLRRQGGHRPGLLRLPSPSGVRPDHRQRRLALHHLRRRRQLRRRLRRQPGDRAAHRSRVPLPARRLEDAQLLRSAIAIPIATSPSTRPATCSTPTTTTRTAASSPAAGSCTSPRGATSAGGCAPARAAACPITCAAPSSANCPARCRRCSRPAAASRRACSSTTTRAFPKNIAACCTIPMSSAS